MVDLKKKPYCLSDEDIKWVDDTIRSMSDEEKTVQLFFQLTASQDEEYLRELANKYHVGGCRYNAMKKEDVKRQNELLQKHSRIPLFIACNTETGGDGAYTDGTYIGSGIKIAATDNTDYAFKLGKYSSEQAAEAGLAGGGEYIASAEHAEATKLAQREQVVQLGGAHAGGEPRFARNILLFLEPGAHGHQHQARGGG